MVPSGRVAPAVVEALEAVPLFGHRELRDDVDLGVDVRLEFGVPGVLEDAPVTFQIPLPRDDVEFLEAADVGLLVEVRVVLDLGWHEERALPCGGPVDGESFLDPGVAGAAGVAGASHAEGDLGERFGVLAALGSAQPGEHVAVLVLLELR